MTSIHLAAISQSGLVTIIENLKFGLRIAPNKPTAEEARRTLAHFEEELRRRESVVLAGGK